MTVARIILAPLLALALVLTQTALATVAMAPAKPANCGCHRAVCCCCQTPANPNSAPRPAAPARAITHSDLQIAAAVVEQVFSGAASPPPSISSVRIYSAPLPLYQRDCVLLI